MSQEFKQFAMQYRFEVQHSSPRYSQSNGFIEAMVKVVKGIMEKAEESGFDPHLAMLIYRATPIRPGQLSPGEMLSQWKYRALLPIHQYLHPNLDISREAQMAQKQVQYDDYDRTAKKNSRSITISGCPVPVGSQENNLAESHGGDMR